MPNLTTNYSLLKPLVADPIDEDLWGGYLNDDMDDIDTLLRQGINITSESSQTSGFTATASISVKKLYPCDATTAGFTATIPTAASAGNGATVFIKKIDSGTNVVTLDRSSTDTLDGATSLTLTAENQCYGLVSDGVSKWNSICKPSNAVPDASTTVKGIVELATVAETLEGVDTTRAVTPAGLAGSNSLSANGYCKMPGGLILQWGIAPSIVYNTWTSVTLPIPFTTAFYNCQITMDGTTTTVSATAPLQYKNLTLTSFELINPDFNTHNLAWFAIGI